MKDQLELESQVQGTSPSRCHGAHGLGIDFRHGLDDPLIGLAGRGADITAK